jgi:hypothetical protein
MKEEASRALRTLESHILLYLVEHPDAKDTREGILKWWVPAGRGETEDVRIQEALQDLVERGWIVERETAASKKIYGLNKDQLPRIRKFLGQNGQKIKQKG